jgi:hypothetical protein
LQVKKKKTALLKCMDKRMCDLFSPLLFYCSLTNLIAIFITLWHADLLIVVSSDSQNAKYSEHTTQLSLFLQWTRPFREHLSLHNPRELTSTIPLDHLYHLLGVGEPSCLPFEQHRMLDVALQHLAAKQRKNQRLANRTSTLYALTSLVEAGPELCSALALG